MTVISERLTDLKHLQRKYGPTLGEVIAFAEKAEATLALLESLEEEIARAEVEGGGDCHRGLCSRRSS